jgi:hypothetical protein
VIISELKSYTNNKRIVLAWKFKKIVLAWKSIQQNAAEDIAFYALDV